MLEKSKTNHGGSKPNTCTTSAKTQQQKKTKSEFKFLLNKFVSVNLFCRVLFAC